MPNYPIISSSRSGNLSDYNFPLIGVGAMFGLFLLIIVYYIVISKNSNQLINNRDRLNNRDKLNNNTLLGSTLGSTWGTTWGANGKLINNSINKIDMNMVSVPTGAKYSSLSAPTVPQIPQVFNIKENQYTLADAPAVCGALGADVATIEQLIDAHKNGADWCNVGWTKDGLAAYPTQLSTWQILQDDAPAKRNSCGISGINLVRNDPNLLYGVNCYGVKPSPKGNEKVKSPMISDKQEALNAQIAKYKQTLNDIGVASFNNSKWSQ